MILYVDPSATGPGQGTQAAPYATLQEAFAAAPAGATVSFVLAPGDYIPQAGRAITLSGQDGGVAATATEVRLLGACADSTVFHGLDSTALYLDEPTLRVVVERITATEGELFVRSATALTVRDCVFQGSSSINGISWAYEGGSLAVERSSFINTDTAVLADQTDSVSLSGSAFEGCGFSCVQLDGFAEASVAGCTFDGGGSGLVVLDRFGGAQPVVVSRTWFSGATERAVAVSNASGVVIRESSFRDFALGILVTDASEVTVQDSRIVGGAAGVDTVGVYATGAANLLVSGALLGDVTHAGLTVDLGSHAAVAGSVVQRCGEGGIRSACAQGTCSGESLIVESTVLRDNGIGIEASHGSASVRDSVVGGSSAQGIRLRGVTAATVEGSTISGNGSVGIEVANLAAGTTDAHVLRDNDLERNVGLGILIRSAPSRVRLDGNRVFGTVGGQVTSTQGSFDVGDGVAVLTGTDGLPSVVSMSGCTVDGSYRVGIIADGEGSVLSIEGTVFGPSNGFGGVGSGLNLIGQNGAQVVGSDAALTGIVAPLPVSNEEILEMIAIGAGGDPR